MKLILKLNFLPINMSVTRSAVLISSNNEEENSWETKIILNQVNSDSEI